MNPNTGEPLGRERRRLSADNTVFHHAAHPSHVVLPRHPLIGHALIAGHGTRRRPIPEQWRLHRLNVPRGG